MQRTNNSRDSKGMIKVRDTDLRFGVIGWGYWGPKIARNLDSLSHASVAMVADMDAFRLADASRNLPFVQTVTQAEDVFNSDVDGVVIATPVRSHYRLAKEALLHGKHVLVEKPLTANVEEAEELVALAHKMQRVLMVGHTFEYHPAVNELRKLIQGGELGKIYCIETERVNLGLFRNDINVIWDLAPHDISILLYIFGKMPGEVTVQAHAYVQPQIPDVAHVNLTFADNMVAHIHVSWLHPCKIRKVTVIGDARMVVYDDTKPAEMITIYNKGADVHADPGISYRNGEITIPYIGWTEPLHLECEDFAHSIRTGEQPRANGGVGLTVVRVLDAIQKVLDRQTSGTAVSFA
jgi:predicted dehydrogenase